MKANAKDHELVEYSDPGHIEPVSLRLDSETQTIWATQAQIAQLFDTNQQNVSYHLKNIFADSELAEDSNTKNIGIAGSAKPVRIYSLDAVISVGYRVNSKAATRFRQWATQTIKAYIEQGYVINEKALRESPEKLNKLAATIRALRAEEKQIYAKVRECFRISSSDYDPLSSTVKKFYALLQDKFHHAVTSMTASKLILDRANHTDDNMGLQTFKGQLPTLQEAKIGKNYLKSDELYRLHLLSEQFLLYAESTALAGRKMTMASLHQQLDRLLSLNDYPIFDGYKDYLKDEADRHAEMEYARYNQKRQIESHGIVYDPEALAEGEYDEILAPD